MVQEKVAFSANGLSQSLAFCFSGCLRVLSLGLGDALIKFMEVYGIFSD